MKNLLYIALGIGFLGIMSSSASGFLTTETSDTLENIYQESFYIEPENIETNEGYIKVFLIQNNKKNAEKKIQDCLDYYQEEFDGFTIYCEITVKQNIAVDDSCVYIKGELIKSEEEVYTTIKKSNSC